MPDPEFTRDVNARAAQLSAERDEKKAKLAELENTRPIRQCPDLLNKIPTGSIDLGQVPEATLRKLFRGVPAGDALRPQGQQGALPGDHHARGDSRSARGG
ncbi:hypothetical protein GCM10010191_38480 [Actinomadura vinacea]|uniref:Uncharacterized protein n=1 Tax=Actinomadura vinacea TaxID=115336 RepID=A0ABN3J7V6_9ACTN